MKYQRGLPEMTKAGEEKSSCLRLKAKKRTGATRSLQLNIPEGINDQLA